MTDYLFKTLETMNRFTRAVDLLYKAFREFLDGQNHFIQSIDAGAFKTSGTNIETTRVTLFN